MILFTAFIIALVVSLLFTPLASRLAFRLGMMDGDSSEDAPGIPSIGGLAIFLGFTASILAGMIIFPVLPGQTIVDTSISWRMLCLLMIFSGLLMTVTGFIDDRIELKPTTKLLLHSIVAAAAGVSSYLEGETEPLPGYRGLYWMAAPITLLWLLGITNSINLLDHADGVTSG